MARTFRWYQKKRGSRRTGSKTWASVGEVVFFAFFLFIGSGVLTSMIFTLVIPEWRVNHEYVERECKIIGKRLAESEGREGIGYRPEFQIQYNVRGVQYRIWTYAFSNPYTSNKDACQAVLTQYTLGDTRECWYDPLKPERVVLVRSYSWWIYLVMFVPLVFIVIGAGGLVYSLLNWGKSAERRSAMAQRIEEFDPRSLAGEKEEAYPNVPKRLDITSSPGTNLQYRLPIETSFGWQLLGWIVACVIWNGIVSVPVYYAVRGFIVGKPDWLLTIFSIPFLICGIFIIVLFFRSLLLAAGIGPTLLEISQHPLHPGDECRIFLSQSGRLTLNSLTLSLVCQEEATYQQGTNTRTESREVYSRELLRRDNFEIPPGLPFETNCLFTIPAEAMHSFKSAHNKIDWKLTVEGNVVGWPDFKRAFSIVVFPVNARSMT